MISTCDHLRRATAGDGVWAKLQKASRDLLGGELVVLIRREDHLLEVYPAAERGRLPGFCTLLRSTSQGRKRCVTCRSLMTFGASYRGRMDYQCHGGVKIIAMPAPVTLKDRAKIIVASCAFADPDRRRGWALAREYAQSLGVDLRSLRREYNRLPVFAEETARVARALVEVAATVVSRMAADLPSAAHQEQGWAVGTAANDDELDRVLKEGFYVAHDAEPAPGRRAGARMVQLAKDMVDRNPGLLFTAHKVARAAGMSSNHFSTVFRAHAGIPFSEHLTAKRIALAKVLLRDLTLNISQVAVRAGFPDKSYFARKFRRATGSTPRQWRQSL